MEIFELKYQQNTHVNGTYSRHTFNLIYIYQCETVNIIS